MKFNYFLLIQSELDEDVAEIMAVALSDLHRQFSNTEKITAKYEKEKARLNLVNKEY